LKLKKRRLLTGKINSVVNFSEGVSPMDRRKFLQVTATATAGATIGAALVTPVLAAQKLNTPPLLKRPLPIYVLNKMAFGPTGDDLLGRNEFHLNQYIESQLYPETIPDTVCEAVLAKANLKTLNKSLKELWKDHKLAADAMKNAGDVKPDQKATAKIADKDEKKDNSKEKAINEIRFQPVRETEIATWIRAVYSKRQLNEVLVDFWHDHFNVNGTDGNIASVFVHYDRDVIRKNIFGNFREFLEATTKSPAMLFYLDNGINQSANPNENYARELFELHTLGVENYAGTMDRKKVSGFATGHSHAYVDGDVYESARAFTGWRNQANQKDADNTGEFAYYEPWHDRFQKIVLGHSLQEYQPPLKDGNDVLDILAAHPGTAHYVCKKLCRRLVCDEPSDLLVKAAAKVFLDHRKEKDQLRQVTRFILQSADFRDTQNAKLKRPFELTVGMIRAFYHDNAADFEFIPGEDFFRQHAATGQRLFQWRTPDGYPDRKDRWSTTSSLTQRWRLANQISFEQFNLKMGWKSLNLKSEGDAQELSREYVKRFLGYSDAATENAIQAFLAKNGDHSKHADPIVRSAVSLVMMAPEFQWR
jgi:uncharacterized protein (DUF1800 family)